MEKHRGVVILHSVLFLLDWAARIIVVAWLIVSAIAVVWLALETTVWALPIAVVVGVLLLAMAREVWHEA